MLMTSSKFFAADNCTAEASLVAGRLRIAWTGDPPAELLASSEYMEWRGDFIQRVARATGRAVTLEG